MSRKRTQPISIKSRPPAVHMTKPPFRPGDIEVLASKAGLPLRDGADAAALRDSMNRLVFEAHSRALVVQNTPAPIAESEAFQGAARAGRALLLTLGLDDDPATIARLDRANIAKRSSVMNNLIRHTDRVPAGLLPADVLDLFGDDAAAGERHKVAAQRYTIEAARAVAFLAAFAEAAQLQPGRRGPVPDVFRSTFLLRLAQVHLDTFGYWPFLSRKAGEDRGGASLRWLREVLRLLSERLTLGLTNEVAFREALGRLMGVDPDTLGRYFETATAQARSGTRPP